MRTFLVIVVISFLVGCGRDGNSNGDSVGGLDRQLAAGVHYDPASVRLVMNAIPFWYSYAPSIVRTGQRSLVWSCTMRSDGGDVIRLTYSDDRINWSAPTVVLTNSSAGNAPFACDPAMVFYQGYYYLYWGGWEKDRGGFISLSRSPLSNPAGFQTYVGGDPNAASSWRAGDSVQPAKLLLPQIGCRGDVNCYGVGQPTLVLKDGLFKMWFTDTTGPSGIYYTTSTDGVNWSPRIYTNVMGASVDVKYDVATNQYLMFELASGVSSEILSVRTSNDGIRWSDAQFLGTPPPHSHNLGVEGTSDGFIDTRQSTLFIGFGAPYTLGAADTWAKWHLYGATIALSSVPTPPPAPTPANSATTDLRRLYASGVGDHLLTTNANENPAGYVFEGIAFRVRNESFSGAQPIYRCYVPSWRDHFISTDPNCEGQSAEGRLGYLATTPNAGLPVYRCFSGRFHLITTNGAECSRNNFKIESILGYAP